MTGLVILAAIVAVLSYPAGPTARGAVGPGVARMVGRVAIVQLVAWAIVCVAMVAGLVLWAVLR